MTDWLLPKNWAITTLDGELASGAGTANVVDGTKLTFPTRATIWSSSYASPYSDSNREIVEITAITGNALTITRAQESTSDNTHPSGSQIAILITEEMWEQLQTVIDALGVTNGNSHDHAGGDGAQISHSGLSNLSITSSGHTMTTARVLGRATADSGDVEEIPVSGTGAVVLQKTPELSAPRLLGPTADKLTVGTPAAAPSSGRIYVDSTIGALRDSGAVQGTFRCGSDTAGTCPTFTFYRSRNTYSSPSPIQANDRVFDITGYAPDSGSVWRSSGVIMMRADGAPTATTAPSKFIVQSAGADIFQTRASGDVEVMKAGGALLCRTGGPHAHAGVDDYAGIYAQDVSSSAELYALDEAGNSTRISPHDPVTGEWVFYSENIHTGRRVQVNMEKLVRVVEEMSGQKLLLEEIVECQKSD